MDLSWVMETTKKNTRLPSCRGFIDGPHRPVHERCFFFQEGSQRMLVWVPFLSHSVHGIPTFTMKINHSCRFILPYILMVWVLEFLFGFPCPKTPSPLVFRLEISHQDTLSNDHPSMSPHLASFPPGNSRPS